MHALWEAMEAPAKDVRSLRRRTDMLIGIHLVLAAAALAVLALVVWRIRHLVTLAQRSNVETLVIAFIVIFLSYVLITTAPATKGAFQLLLLRAFGHERAQRWLQSFADRQPKETKRAYLNVQVRGPRPEPIVVRLEDDFGHFGSVRADGAEIALLETPRAISHTTLQLVAHTLAEVGRQDEARSKPRIVSWAGIDEEGAERYGSLVQAFARLEEALGRGPLWPALEVDAAGVRRLGEVMREATPLIREDLLLPDLEYSAEFTIPIIPEPIPFMQMRRRREHADAVATMGCAALMALAMFALVAWVIVNPPWVPSP